MNEEDGHDPARKAGMTMGNRGDGPYTHSFANGNGPGIPAWLRYNLEYAMVREAQYSSWTVMA